MKGENRAAAREGSRRAQSIKDTHDDVVEQAGQAFLMAILQKLLMAGRAKGTISVSFEVEFDDPKSSAAPVAGGEA